MQFEGVPSLAQFVSICYANNSRLHHNRAPSRWTINHRGRVHPAAHPPRLPHRPARLGEHRFLGLPEHTPGGHQIVSTAGYHQLKMDLSQLQRPSEGISNHLERTWYKMQFLCIWIFSHRKLLIRPTQLDCSLITQRPYVTTAAESPDGSMLSGGAGTMCGSLPERQRRSWRSSAPSPWDGRAPGKTLFRPSSKRSSFIRS